MTPVAHWSPDDYYRASRGARRAWQATNAQLEIGGLDEGVARAGFRPVLGCGPLVEPDDSAGWRKERGRLDAHARSFSEPVLPHSPLGAGSPSRHTNGGAAPVPSDERGIPGKEHRR